MDEPGLLDEFQSVGGHTDLIADDLMATAGVAYQVHWNLFVCCETLLHAENIFTHFTKVHSKETRPSAAVKERLTALIARWNLPKSYQEFAPTVEPRLSASGIPVLHGLHGCPHCAVTGGLKYITTHLGSAVHAQEPKLPMLQGLDAQVVNRAHCRVVERPPVPQALDGALSLGEQMAAFHCLAADDDGLTTTNSRLISPFLHRTKWHEIREPYKPHLAHLIDLAAFPLQDEFRNLIDAVRLYFRNADQLFENTNILLSELGPEFKSFFKPESR
ncbi:hypothetical protein B0H12DRAFT_1082204 [Mycena haematopus]|nr:hypothetical protein B0H12DRAFT_1082204 [Mycena haematopus]